VAYLMYLDCGYPLPSGAEVKERLELYIYSLPGPLFSSVGRYLPLYLPILSRLFSGETEIDHAYQ
jgi:hypothetical protein